MSNESQLPIDAKPSDEVRLGLVNALFADSRSMLPGSVVASSCGLLCAILTDEVMPLLIGIATLAITIVRVQLALLHARRTTALNDVEIGHYERIYVLGATAYMFCNGALATWAFTTSDSPFILLITFLVALTNAISIAVRSFAIAYGVWAQLAAVLLPMAVGFAVRGGWFWLVAVLIVLLSLFIYSSAARLRNILLSEMAYRLRSETAAAQLDFAINNMSHGMCMISARQTLLVSNAKFAEFLGLSPARPITDSQFKTLLRYAARKGAIDKMDGARLLKEVSAPAETNAQRSLQIETVAGKVFDVTLKRNSDGGWVVVVQDVTEKRRAESVINRMARFDGVTGLRNRNSFEMALGDALYSAQTSGARTEVLFIDLDGFKQVNDTLGHKVGDRLLSTAGDRLSSIAAPGDMIARWGGDEFVVLRGVDVTAEDTEAFAAQIINELSRPSMIEGSEVVVGASIGIAVAIGGDLSTDFILQQADMALYAAKRAGRSRYRIYEESMSESARERRLLELDLHAALAARAFELYYQPIVDLKTKAVVSFEALARWKHPIRGQVSPGLFVPILEELNLMNVFGGWALQRACLDAANWPHAIRVGINVSTKQLESDSLYDSVLRALQISSLEPNRLELEITETALLGANDVAEKTLARLRSLGVRIALDDFGTGFSSLSHLMRLPLDKVKIDQSFTKQLGRDRKAEILIENIARLSSQLGMIVTVEGVETQEQLDRIQSFHAITEGQGYLFSRPLPLEAIESWFLADEKLNVA